MFQIKLVKIHIRNQISTPVDNLTPIIIETIY